MRNVYIKHSDDENSLTHYGVKGMKWRKHKARGNDETSIYERYKMYGINEPDQNARIEKLGAAEKAFSAGYTTRREGKLKARRSVTKTLSSFGKSSLSKTKKSVSKGASFLSKKFGGYRIKTGKMNTVSANGKKHKRYVSVTKNGRPKAFIPY